MAALQKQECIWPIPPTPVTAVSWTRRRPQRWPPSALTYPWLLPELWSGRREKIEFYCVTVSQFQLTYSFMQRRSRGLQVFEMHTHKKRKLYLLWQCFCLGQNGDGRQFLRVGDASPRADAISLILYSYQKRKRRQLKTFVFKSLPFHVQGSRFNLKLQERQQSLQLIFRKIATQAGISKRSQILTCQDPEQHAWITHDWVS